MVKKSTVRKWLDKARFDWEHGTIIWQHSRAGDPPGFAEVVARDNPMLDEEFVTSYGICCPTFIAMDLQKIYFAATYDGSTWLEWIWIDIRRYLLEKPGNMIPIAGA